MPTKKINPIEEHFEKGVLGIAVIVLLYTLFAYMISSPTNVLIDGEVARPGQAYLLVRQNAERIEQKARDQQSQWPKIQVPATATTRDPALKLVGLPDDLKLALAPVVPMNIGGPERNKQITILTKYDLPPVPVPEKLVFSTGRSTLELKSTEYLQDLLKNFEDEAEISWVTVAGQIDMEKQRSAMEYLPEKLEREPLFFRADLQRTQVGADGKLGKWVDVPSVLDPKALLLEPNKPLTVDSFDNLTAAIANLFRSPTEIENYALTPAFPPLTLGGPDEWKDPTESEKEIKAQAEVKPAVEKPKPVRRAPRSRSVGPGLGGGLTGGPGGLGGNAPMMGNERPRRGGNRPTEAINRQRAGGPEMGPGGMPGMPGMPMGPGGMDPRGPGGFPMGPGGPGMPQQRVTPQRETMRMTDEQRKNQKTLTVWVHDLTATPGKTYKYRMRVVMFNPLAGYTPILKKPENTLLVGIEGSWSESSVPVTVERENYFFLSNVSNGAKSVTVTIYKWNAGYIYKENFEVKPGQSIGGKKMVGKTWRNQLDGKIIESRQEIDFGTGATLQEVTPNVEVTVQEAGKPSTEARKETATVITVKMDDGTILKQDTLNISFDKDIKKYKDVLYKQGRRLVEAKAKDLIEKAKAGKEK
ncbi:MAG: hypothetical protein WC975_05785 [Phycisphaerae bacterium]